MRNEIEPEQLFPFARAGDLIMEMGFPRPSQHILKMWRRHGIRGHYLRARRLGGRFYISEASVREFVAACDEGAR